MYASMYVCVYVCVYICVCMCACMCPCILYVYLDEYVCVYICNSMHIWYAYPTHTDIEFNLVCSSKRLRLRRWVKPQTQTQT
jgi:hypothetical protein